jgi:hypothetical protein
VVQIRRIGEAESSHNGIVTGKDERLQSN